MAVHAPRGSARRRAASAIDAGAFAGRRTLGRARDRDRIRHVQRFEKTNSPDSGKASVRHRHDTGPLAGARLANTGLAVGLTEGCINVG